MPLFLDTRGKSTLGIGICARCSRKMPLADMYSDPNAPGLRVCLEDRDSLDPWRLPPPAADDITLQYPRPDTQLWPFDPVDIWANQISGITRTFPAVVWQATRFFRQGASVTPENVNDVQVTLPQYEFIALNSGISGSTTPDWPTKAGVEVVDGAITWLCVGIFLLDGNEPAFPASEFSRVIPSPVVPPVVIVSHMSNDGGLLVLDPDVTNWPTDDGASVAAGGLFSNGGVVSVKAGGTPASLAATAYFFGSITAAQLLALGGNALPDVQPTAGSLRLWQLNGEVLVA